jgi:hypothetical protein
MEPGGRLPDEDDRRLREVVEWLAALPKSQSPEDVAKWFEVLFSSPPSGPMWDRFKTLYVSGVLDGISEERASEHARPAKGKAIQVIGLMTMTFLARTHLELLDSFIELL